MIHINWLSPLLVLGRAPAKRRPVKPVNTGRLNPVCIIALFWLLGVIPALAASPPSTSPTVIDVGIQPMGYPVAIISAVMERDAVMRRDLAAINLTVNFIPYKKGNDMVELVGNDQLEAAFLGDMPTIRTIARTDVRIVGLVKQTFTSVVGRKIVTPGELKGKRIGYAIGSSAHHTLLQALRSAGLSEQDVQLVPLEINEMPQALADRRVDAFSGWEPAPSLARAKVPECRILFKGSSSDYFLVADRFARRNPAAAKILATGFLRAIRWMQGSQNQLEQAATWAINDSGRFSGRASGLTIPQATAIAQRELLSIPSAPVIVKLPGESPRLTEEFNFLKNLGKIPANADPGRLRTAFDCNILQQVIRDGSRLRLKEFAYQP